MTSWDVGRCAAMLEEILDAVSDAREYLEEVSLEELDVRRVLSKVDRALVVVRQTKTLLVRNRPSRA